MVKPPQNFVKNLLLTLPRCASWVIISMASLVILGVLEEWQYASDAIHFIMVAVLLVCLQRRNMLLTRLLSVAIGVIPLVNVFSGLQHMTAGTSVCLILLSLGANLMTVARGHLVRLLMALGCICLLFAFGFVNLVASMLELDQALGWPALNSMAPLSALMIVLSGLSLMILALQEQMIPAHVRTVTTFLVLSSSLFLTLFGWQAAVYVEEMQLKQQSALKVQAMQDLVQAELMNFSKSLTRMAHRWVIAGSTSEQLWRSDALNYHRHLAGTAGIGYADASTVIRWIEPKETNGSAEGFQLDSEAARHDAIQLARESNQAALTRAVELKQGGLGFLLLVPLKKQDHELGLVYCVIRYEEIVRGIVKLDGYALVIREGEKTLFEHKPPTDRDASFWRTSSTLVLPGTSWNFTVEPGPEMIQDLRRSMSLSILGAGLLFSVLTVTLLHLYFKAQDARDQAGRLMQWNHAIVNGSQLAIISMDRHGRIKSFNPAAEKLLGYAADEVLEQATPLLWHEPNELKQRAAALSQELGQTIPADFSVFSAKADRGEVYRQHWTYLTKSGESRTVDLAVHSLRDESSAIHGYVSIVEDISDKVRHEQELQEALTRAEVATVAKSRFLANMSHEIRTPINGIMGMVRLMLDSRLDHEQRVYGEAIQTSADNLLVIVNDILDLSKVEAGRLELETTQFRLPDLLQAVEANLGFVARKKGIAFQKIIGPDLPDFVLGDPTRIRQILLNLVSNAIKFTPAGQVVMKASVIKQTPAEAKVLFEVIDSGIGIAKDAQTRIFQPFVQADASTTRRFGGSGLGLSISGQLVQLMKGQIGVESDVNQGARFWFVLDLPRAQPLSAPAMPHAHVITERLHILLVEDNAINQIVAKNSLQKYGYELRVVNNGQEALDALAQTPFHLILMDCEMPVMDGFEATRRIRSSGKAYQNIPIIAMTANAMSGDREQCLKAGMNEYIPKPFVMQDVVRTIQKVIINLRAAA